MRNGNLSIIVESIERLEGQKAEIAEAIKERKAHAKSVGYSLKALNVVLRRRRMAKHERDELDALVDLYQADLGMLEGTPLGNAAVERLERLRKEAREEPEAAPTPPEPEPETPADTEADARAKGAEAARSGVPVTANPYPPRSALRAAWDEAWCQETGSDGMDLPSAWRPTPKPPKKPKPSDDVGEEGGDE